MTALNWPEIKRRLKGLRARVEIERRQHRLVGNHLSAEKRENELAALDAVLAIEAADPDQFLPNVPS